MTPEEKILERLEAIEDKLSDLQASKENSRMLIEQLTPIGNHAFRLAIEELETQVLTAKERLTALNQ